MIDLDIIEREIHDLEARGETTYSMCDRLSMLYIVRDHLLPTREDDRMTRQLTGSEFLEAASGVSYPALMEVLDEHMSGIRVVYPREYENVMGKIRALR